VPTIAVKTGLRTSAKGTPGDQLRGLLLVDTDPPGHTHRLLRDHRGDDPHHGQHHPDKPRGGNIQRSDRAEQLQQRPRKTEQQGENEQHPAPPLHRTGLTTHPTETGRAGAPVLHPAAQPEREQQVDQIQPKSKPDHHTPISATRTVQQLLLYQHGLYSSQHADV
jgi:hypothetical protein